MQKQFEIVPRRDGWDVRHNSISFRVCQHKRDAIRVALTLGRMQQRLGDDAEIVLRDCDGATRAQRRISAHPAP